MIQGWNHGAELENTSQLIHNSAFSPQLIFFVLLALLANLTVPVVSQGKKLAIFFDMGLDMCVPSSPQ